MLSRNQNSTHQGQNQAKKINVCGSGGGWKEVGTAREGFKLLTSNNQRLRSAGNNAVLCIHFT